jgi:hypothetical protein
MKGYVLVRAEKVLRSFVCDAYIIFSFSPSFSEAKILNLYHSMHIFLCYFYDLYSQIYDLRSKLS